MSIDSTRPSAIASHDHSLISSNENDMNIVAMHFPRALFLLVALLTANGALANANVLLSDGIHVNTYSVLPGDKFSVDFSLRESSNVATSSVHVKVLMVNQRGGPYIELEDFGTIDFYAGETKPFSLERSLMIDLNLQEGLYSLAVVYSLPNGDIVPFDDEQSAINRLKIDVANDLLGYEGYFLRRTDQPEFRWVGRLPNGQLGHTWVDDRCARLFGSFGYTGSWRQLSILAPAGDTAIPNPCSAGLVNANNVKLYSGVTVNPPNPSVGERFEVVFDLGETDYRPVIFSNIQVSIENSEYSTSVDLGETRFDAATTHRFRAVFDSSHQLEAGTYRVVVRYQLLGDKAKDFVEQNTDSGALEIQIEGTATPLAERPDSTTPEVVANTEGYVFSRTDKAELRWVGTSANGQLGHTWIDETCATSLGGTSRQGTWSDLSALAPAGDQSVANPCNTIVDEVPIEPPVEVSNPVNELPEFLFVNDGQGFVYFLSGSSDYRWVGRSPTGEFGHTWISEECAKALGLASIAGNWQWLSTLAPAGDQTVSSPCESIEHFVQGGDGYVYSRTDASEYRWIGRLANGDVGHTWIDKQCVDSLGGVSAKGNWVELHRRASAGNSSELKPCQNL